MLSTADIFSAFCAARKDVLEAAKILMPCPQAQAGDLLPYPDCATHEQTANAMLLEAIKATVFNRQSPIKALRQSAREIATGHKADHPKYHAAQKYPIAITPVSMKAAARRDVAYDIAAVLASNDVHIGTPHRCAYLRDAFLKIADDCVKAYELDGRLHLYTPESIAKVVTPYHAPAR